jgi:hypothetical protein
LQLCRRTERRSKVVFQFKLYIFNQGDGNSIAVTSQTL